MNSYEHKAIHLDDLFIENRYGRTPGYYGWRLVGIYEDRAILERPFVEGRPGERPREDGSLVT